MVVLTSIAVTAFYWSQGLINRHTLVILTQSDNGINTYNERQQQTESHYLYGEKMNKLVYCSCSVYSLEK